MVSREDRRLFVDLLISWKEKERLRIWSGSGRVTMVRRRDAKTNQKPLSGKKKWGEEESTRCMYSFFWVAFLEKRQEKRGCGSVVWYGKNRDKKEGSERVCVSRVLCWVRGRLRDKPPGVFGLVGMGVCYEKGIGQPPDANADISGATLLLFSYFLCRPSRSAFPGER
jgi:hypothetical protein